MDDARSSTPSAIADRYAKLLESAVFAEDPLSIESALTDAADLGRVLVAQEIPLEEVGELHHEALLALARTHPDIPLSRVAARITAPLMETYMAYSLAFREQLERRAEAIVHDRLEQSRRLEAIGTLAAGIAHDFNNILGSILGFTELLGDDLPAGTPMRGYLDYIQQASFRARDLISRLLTFARAMADSPPVPIEVVAQIREILTLLQVSLPASIRLEFEPAVPAAWVLAEPTQVQQIIMNLCINAADAIGRGQGRIRVAIDLLPAQGELCDASDYMARLTVRDDGEGMSPEVQARVFDPFFTTKAPGRGSGLGLSVIHGLVGKLQGRIEISSSPGAGSTFIIDLPGLSADHDPKIRQQPNRPEDSE